MTNMSAPPSFYATIQPSHGSITIPSYSEDMQYRQSCPEV
jgi:hypothetical protein